MAGIVPEERKAAQSDPGVAGSREEGFSVSKTTVRELLARKKQGTYTIGSGASVLDAIRLMAEKNVGALIVVDWGKVAGVISERDYARKVILTGKTSRETEVGEIMSSPAVTVSPETTVGECMELMTRSFIRHLPVMDDGVLIGCVSIGDVVKAIITDQQRLIGQFQDYISGAYPT